MFGPQEIHSIWDNSGSCYHDCLCLDDTPTHPLGFSQFSTCQAGKHLGKRIRWTQLPDDLQTHIIGRLAT